MDELLRTLFVYTVIFSNPAVNNDWENILEQTNQEETEVMEEEINTENNKEEASLCLGFEEGSGIDFKIVIPHHDIIDDPAGVECAYLSLHLTEYQGPDNILLDIGLPDENNFLINPSDEIPCQKIQTSIIENSLGWKHLDITNIVKNYDWNNGICIDLPDSTDALLRFTMWEFPDSIVMPDCVIDDTLENNETDTNQEAEQNNLEILENNEEIEVNDNIEQEPIDTLEYPEESNETLEYEEDITTSIGEVLGSNTSQTSNSNSECLINYYTDTHKIEKVYCTTPTPVITETIHKKTSSDYSIKVSGKINIKTKLKIKLHRCKEKTIWDPRTYFMCVYEEYKEISYMTKTRNLVIPDISTNNYTIDRQISNNGAYSFTLSIEKNLKGKDLYIKFKRTISDTVVGNRFVFVEMTPKSNIIQIPAPSTSQSYKPLDFMFKNYYGVTQWHGYTAYMSPHTGIDFGATKEEVVAPADGVVVATGWDNYYGECLSGGKYLKIKHKDDLYSIYFHLSKIHKNIGDIVEKGENIAISGNTGAFNCQPLAYHLHFETRNSSSQESHTDPVLLVNANWNKIPTLGWKQYPGRLSGDNPHPDF